MLKPPDRPGQQHGEEDRDAEQDEIRPESPRRARAGAPVATTTETVTTIVRSGTS